MFLVSNSKDAGQFYYDKSNQVVYICHFSRPAPGKEIVPFSWLLAICILISIFRLPYFFVHPFVFLLVNFVFFTLELCLGALYTKRKRMQIEKEGTAYVLKELNKEELKKIKQDFLRGIVIYAGLNYAYSGSLIFSLFVVVVILFAGKQYIISITFLLYAIEWWGYDFYFTRRKHQTDLLNEIDSQINARAF